MPVRTLNAGPNPCYFGPGRSVTYLNFLSDQFAGFHAIVVPGTLRDSLYILDGLLEQQTGLEPQELMTDTAGYSDQVFGLFRLLGYQFSPRLADIGAARFWRIDRGAATARSTASPATRSTPTSSPPLGRPAARRRQPGHRHRARL